MRIELRDLVLVVPIHRLFLKLGIFRFLEETALSIGLEKNRYVSDLVEIGPLRISTLAPLPWSSIFSWRGRL
jgi:hypothetical protein